MLWHLRCSAIGDPREIHLLIGDTKQIEITIQLRVLRLDATNVVPKPLATIITSVDFDHMAYLGNTLAKIAAEKAGIAKKGVPLICPELAAEAMRVVRGTLASDGTPEEVGGQAIAADFFGKYVVSDIFIHGVANKTLARMKQLAEAGTA